MNIQAEYEAMARRAGELAPEEPLRPTLLEFAELVVAKCAEIGQLYGDWDRNAGDHIRAIMYDVPGLLPEPRQSSHEPS